MAKQKLSDQDASVDGQTDQGEEDTAEEEAPSQSFRLLLASHFLKRFHLFPPHLLILLLSTDLLHSYNFLSHASHCLELPRKQPYKHFIPEIELQALLRHSLPQLFRIVPAA